MNKLIFIDTNIFLDLYRVQHSDFRLSMLKHIVSNQEKIISTVQVEMEYKKNRQQVILGSLRKFKIPDWGGLTPPALLADAAPTKAIEKNKEEIKLQHKKLKKRIEGILRKPEQNDPVYKDLQKFFDNKGLYKLSRYKKEHDTILRLAWKRFILGYPPRKETDNSVGDAINWEWVIACGSASGEDIIIVSRDGDYGSFSGKEPILNDWLSHEFKVRVSRKRKITLTDKLTQAFKMAAVAITKREEEEEKDLIKSLDRFSREYAVRRAQAEESLRQYHLNYLKVTELSNLRDSIEEWLNESIP